MMMTTSMSSLPTQSTYNIKERLEQCLIEIRKVMEETEQQCKIKYIDPPIWILKGSIVNKGKVVYIVHLYKEVIDHCWNDS
jgi:hypothetical protein